MALFPVGSATEILAKALKEAKTAAQRAVRLPSGLLGDVRPVLANFIYLLEMTTPMATKTLPFDPAEHLTDPADQVELLTDALATGDAAYIANALGTIARARGMSTVARGVDCLVDYLCGVLPVELP